MLGVCSLYRSSKVVYCVAYVYLSTIGHDRKVRFPRGGKPSQKPVCSPASNCYRRICVHASLLPYIYSSPDRLLNRLDLYQTPLFVYVPVVAFAFDLYLPSSAVL